MAVYVTPEVCKTCLSYWQPDPAKRGECRFDPPLMLGRSELGHWPAVDEREWCRKWEAATVSAAIDAWLTAHPEYVRTVL